jgi:hypothetical protein
MTYLDVGLFLWLMLLKIFFGLVAPVTFTCATLLGKTSVVGTFLVSKRTI